jgi:hypothetical protein
MYVAIDRKPENGCEIQSAACGQSGIMIRLTLVKIADEEHRCHDHVHNRLCWGLNEQDESVSSCSPELFNRVTGNPRAGSSTHLTPSYQKEEDIL